MASSTRFRHRMRCNDCKYNPSAGGGRFTLKKHPNKYAKAIKCPHCKGLNVVSVEAHRRREIADQDTCCCYPIPFPHRKGSMRFCEHHELADIEPNEDDHRYHQSMLETPRSG